MKKLIAFIMAMALFCSISVTAFAEDSSAGNGQSEIRTHIYSSYNITIPAVIDLANGNRADVELTNAMLEDGYAINVYLSDTEPSGGIRLMHTNGIDSIECTFSNIESNMMASNVNPLVTFNKSDIVESTSTKQFEINAETMGIPGNYTGIMNYTFECSPIN